jgi:small subunit ribosomal protein S5
MAQEDKLMPPDDAGAAAPDTAGTAGPGGQRRGRRNSSREGGGGGGGGRRGGDNRQEREQSEWEEKIIQVRRVTKVVKGGKKLSFRAVVVVGNGKGQVGIGVGKAAEVIGAIQKGVVDAKKSLVNVPLVGATIPHQIVGKQGSSRIIMKPASKGTGIIAGGAARSILELAGVGDVLAKSLGSRSPLNVARATIDGLSRLRTFEEAARLRGISLRTMLA